MPDHTFGADCLRPQKPDHNATGIVAMHRQAFVIRTKGKVECLIRMSPILPLILEGPPRFEAGASSLAPFWLSHIIQHFLSLIPVHVPLI